MRSLFENQQVLVDRQGCAGQEQQQGPQQAIARDHVRALFALIVVGWRPIGALRSLRWDGQGLQQRGGRSGAQ